MPKSAEGPQTITNGKIQCSVSIDTIDWIVPNVGHAADVAQSCPKAQTLERTNRELIFAPKTQRPPGGCNEWRVIERRIRGMAFIDGIAATEGRHDLQSRQWREQEVDLKPFA